MDKVLTKNKLISTKEGIKDGFPIALGYFTTALAFGLLCRVSLLNFIQSSLISLTNFSGSGQFLMMSLFNQGSSVLEIGISVLFLNSRYIFMASSIKGKLENPNSVLGRLFCGFGTTDEVFAVSTLKGRSLDYTYMSFLILVSNFGWVSGTIVGFLVGNFLPPIIQRASVITVYAMFASLLGEESRKNYKAILVLIFSSSINSFLILTLKIGTGISFIVSMLFSSVFASLIYKDEEVFDE